MSIIRKAGLLVGAIGAMATLASTAEGGEGGEGGHGRRARQFDVREAPPVVFVEPGQRVFASPPPVIFVPAQPGLNLNFNVPVR